MEYIQTILFQIPASRLEEASEPNGLLSELDSHRSHLRGLAGFRDIRITRSINNEGNVLIVVETRWTDDASLVRYETNEPNAASIVRKHSDLLVRDSLQVLDMEALRTESSWRPAEQATAARQRVILPIVIPLGVLAFALLVIYGLSRIYLEIRGDGATALAAGIAIGVLLIAFYLANNPRASGVQIGGIVVLAAVVLAGGTIWALVEEDETAEGEHVTEPTGSPGEGTPEPGGGGAETVIMGDNFFEVNGERNPTFTVASGATLDLTNEGAAIHNMHVALASGYPEDFCQPGGEAPCSDPATIRGGQSGTITIDLDPGEYDYRCDFHPAEMVGTLTVE